MRRLIDTDAAELVFRLFFSSIFVVLGGEHILDDTLIQRLMPEWVPMKRAVSVLSGVVLLVGGGSIALGIYIRPAAVLLGVFLIVVTLLVHVPGILHAPGFIGAGEKWLWDVYQRSNFIKNVCLLGVCMHLLTHEPGRYTLGTFLSGDAGRGGSRN